MDRNGSGIRVLPVTLELCARGPPVGRASLCVYIYARGCSISRNVLGEPTGQKENRYDASERESHNDDARGPRVHGIRASLCIYLFRIMREFARAFFFLYSLRGIGGNFAFQVWKFEVCISLEDSKKKKFRETVFNRSEKRCKCKMRTRIARATYFEYI